jgi:hypothetical protein
MAEFGPAPTAGGRPALNVSVRSSDVSAAGSSGPAGLAEDSGAVADRVRSRPWDRCRRWRRPGKLEGREARMASPEQPETSGAGGQWSRQLALGAAADGVARDGPRWCLSPGLPDWPGTGSTAERSAPAGGNGGERGGRSGGTRKRARQRPGASSDTQLVSTVRTAADASGLRRTRDVREAITVRRVADAKPAALTTRIRVWAACV